MAWIRLSDNYVDHPKFDRLSDGSFRLWHEAMSYCRRHQSDGFFSFSIMRGFRHYTKAREKQLASPHEEGCAPLWELVPGGGYKVHDYLEWNPSRDEENERRTDSREKMRLIRERRYQKGTAPVSPVSNNTPSIAVPANSPSVRPVVTNHDVQDRDKDKKQLEKEEDEIFARGGRLREDLYPAWYAKYRKGARLMLVANSVEHDAAVRVCRLWDDARIEKLARIILTTDEPFIASTDRSFKIFAMKASWADDRLRQAESGAA